MRNTQANRTKFLQGYLKILLSWKTKKYDFSVMEKALEELNQSLPKQRKIKLCKGTSDLWNNLRSNLVSDLRSDLRSDLWSNLGSDLGSDLWNNLRSDLWNNLRSDLRSDLGSDLWSDLGSDLWNNLRSDLGSETWEYYEFIWPVFVGKFNKTLPTIKRCSKTIQALDKCIKAGIGYVWLSSETLYAIPFPKITIDSEKRLHCENGPACEWSDKEKSYWIHGVEVSREIVESPEKLTKKDWLKEENLEVRRIIQDRMPDFAKKIGGEVISKDQWGKLLEIKLPNDPDTVARYVQVKDSSTPRVYFLRVPPTVSTPKEAISWTFGLEVKDYNPEEES